MIEQGQAPAESSAPPDLLPRPLSAPTRTEVFDADPTLPGFGGFIPAADRPRLARQRCGIERRLEHLQQRRQLRQLHRVALAGLPTRRARPLAPDVMAARLPHAVGRRPGSVGSENRPGAAWIGYGTWGGPSDAWNTAISNNTTASSSDTSAASATAGGSTAQTSNGTASASNGAGVARADASRGRTESGRSGESAGPRGDRDLHRDVFRPWRPGSGYSPVYLVGGLGYYGGDDGGDALPPAPPGLPAVPPPPAGPPVPPGGPLLPDPPAAPFPPPAAPPVAPAPAAPADPAAAAAQQQAQAQAKAERDAAEALNRVNADLAKAQADVDAAAARVRQSLKDNADYTSAVTEKKAAEAQADAVRAGLGDAGNSRGDLAEMFPIAQRGLEAGRKVRQIEAEAMAADPQLTQAKARVQALIAVRKSVQGGPVAVQ